MYISSCEAKVIFYVKNLRHVHIFVMCTLQMWLLYAAGEELHEQHCLLTHIIGVRSL